ncbi:unnamed protein product [Chrysoparadoxa australica]
MSPKKAESKRVTVLVLGDVGRSPRMQYHALSLADKGVEVALVGYKGENCFPAVESHSRLRKHLFVAPLSSCKWLKEHAYLLFAALKAVMLVAKLLWLLLMGTPRAEAILVQNPPAVPALAVVWVTCMLRGSRMVIDWHNIGATMFQYPSSHVIGRLLRCYEVWFGRQAHAGFCVSKTMSEWLREVWRVEAQVVYDRPPAFFQRLSIEEQHQLWLRLCGKGGALAHLLNDGEESPFTRDGVMRQDRPALLVSSTSWTEDEDFGLLLQALTEMDEREWPGSGGEEGFQRIVVVVTGKGPQKAMYQQRIAALALKRITICTAWLEAGDYPRLLACADLGVCLHTSTSGLDLPMKVVDMLGSGVPVCAYSYPALPELVHEGENGAAFDTAGKLAEKLSELLIARPKALAVLQSNVRSNGGDGWKEQWAEMAWPVLRGQIEKGGGQNARVMYWVISAALVALCAVILMSMSSDWQEMS